MSDSDQEDLDLEALKSIFGSNAFNDSPPIKEKKKKASTKKSNKGGPKKASKQKKAPINLDDLLDGVNFDSAPNDNDNGIDEFNFSNIQKEINPKKANTKKIDNDIFGFQTTDVFSDLEKRIEHYLETELQTMRNDVIKEIEQALIENDNFDDITIDFIEKLNHSIYDLITYEGSNTTFNYNSFNNIFENFSSQYLSSFRKASEFASSSNLQKINIIRSCRSLIEAKHPILERQMNNAVQDINNELSELNNARSRDTSFDNENKKRMRNYFHQYVFLEGKMKALDEMNENVIKRLEKIQESKNRYFSNANKNIPDEDIFIKHVHNASHYLKSNFLPKKINNLKLINRKADNFFYACKDLLSSVNQVEAVLDKIKNSFVEIETHQEIQTKMALNKFKIVEETRNDLMENKNTGESQLQYDKGPTNHMKKRGKTQIDE